MCVNKLHKEMWMMENKTKKANERDGTEERNGGERSTVSDVPLPREVHDDDRHVVERAGVQGLLHQTLGSVCGVDPALAQTLNKVHGVLVRDLCGKRERKTVTTLLQKVRTASKQQTLSQRPSQAMTMKGTSEPSEYALRNGTLDTKSSSALFRGILNSASPSARLTANEPSTRPNTTCPPAFSMRSRSSGELGLCLYVTHSATRPSDFCRPITASASPRLPINSLCLDSPNVYVKCKKS